MPDETLDSAETWADESVHANEWWDDLYSGDPAIAEIVDLHCVFCNAECDQRDDAAHLSVQLARRPGQVSLGFAHVRCLREATHPSRRTHLIGLP